MRFLLYAHSGSYNHGSEAIIYCTINLIRKKYPNAWIGVSTHFPEWDKEFMVQADEFFEPDVEIWNKEKKEQDPVVKKELAKEMYAKALETITKDTVLLSVGGDNYCYGNWHRLEVFQEKAVSEGAKSILWGASIEPSAITKEMVCVLNSYDIILARESITYEAILKSGVYTRVELIPDIAFVLLPGKQVIQMPTEKRLVGINLSPLVLRKEVKDNILFENFLKLIDTVIEKGFEVVLIPHVLAPADNDIMALKELYEKVPMYHRDKVLYVDRHLSAREYKAIVSRCEYVICSRTHVSVAAYSMKIPTIVIGYSVKSVGIATDLGVKEMVINVEDICTDNVLSDVFESAYTKEASLKKHFDEIMDEYIKRTDKYEEYL